MRLTPIFAATSLLLAPVSLAIAQPSPPSAAAPIHFVTAHSGTFDGRTVRYTATVAETLIGDDPALPPIKLVTTAYVRSDGDAAHRPVLFFFNGGPGAASEWLHVGAFGPKRLPVPQDPTAPVPPVVALVDNPFSLLDAADLVFIDPAETGFSRIQPGGDRAKLYTTTGDAKSISDFIQTWIKANNRQASPRYVVGESYGTVRAALVAGLLSKTMPLDGVVLISQAANIIETSQREVNPIGYATNITALAAIAAYHGRADMHGMTLDAFIDQAYAWGMTDYLQALVQGQNLPDSERRRVAARLQAFTGISSDYYLTHNLIITKVDFRSELLRDKDLILGIADARYVGPAPAAGQAALNPFAKVQDSIDAPFLNYLATDLGVTLQKTEYRPFAPGVNKWVYNPTRGDGGPFSDWDYPSGISAAMKAKPTFRLMITTGYYDTMTAIGPAEFMVAKSDWPKDRVVMKRYVGGHTSYTHEPSLKAMTSDVRRFISAP